MLAMPQLTAAVRSSTPPRKWPRPAPKATPPACWPAPVARPQVEAGWPTLRGAAAPRYSPPPPADSFRRRCALPPFAGWLWRPSSTCTASSGTLRAHIAWRGCESAGTEAAPRHHHPLLPLRQNPTPCSLAQLSARGDALPDTSRLPLLFSRFLELRDVFDVRLCVCVGGGAGGCGAARKERSCPLPPTPDPPPASEGLFPPPPPTLLPLLLLLLLPPLLLLLPLLPTLLLLMPLVLLPLQINQFVSGWFRGAPAEAVLRGNLEDFVAYGFHCRVRYGVAAAACVCVTHSHAEVERRMLAHSQHPPKRTRAHCLPPPLAQTLEQLSAAEQRRVRSFVDDVEAAWGVRFRPGFDPALPFMAHVWEPLR